MDKKDVLGLLEYNRWAKNRLLTSLEPMKQDDFEKDLHSSHGGIRGTLLHMLNAENIWSSRLTGRAFQALDEAELKDLVAIKAKWDELDINLGESVNKFTDEQLQAPLEYQDMRGNKYSQPRIWALQQLFNHFTYHRGQIVAMQRQLGYQPVNTDLIGFYREKGK